MNRRSFLRSLAVGVALAMAPHIRERPPMRGLITDWHQRTREYSSTDLEYRAVLDSILRSKSIITR